MVKWYNESLPRISREFDSPWPHCIEKSRKKSGFFLCSAARAKHFHALRGESKLRTMFCELPSEQNEEKPSRKASLFCKRSETK